MKVITSAGVIEIGTTETAPTIGLTDYSRRETDGFGVTTVVKRNFSRTMSVRVMVPTANIDALQRQLAALRATPVQWVADDRFESLSITGFYKDMSLDLAIPPVSYCTLTIEGLAEGAEYVDPGVDPATDQRKSTLRLLRPSPIDNAVLTGSNVPENDYPLWSAAATYALGARVILNSTHRIYESAANGNVGNDPTGISGQWIDIAPTNRWAMFDQALGSQTERSGSIVVSLDPVEAIDAIALLDVTAASVRVQGAGYDRTLAPAAQPGAVTFLDLPLSPGPLTVTISGSGAVSVGTLLIGKLLGLGTTESSPTAAITDYSRKETDDFGDVTVVERAWAKRMDVRALVSTAAVDIVAARLADVRATPALWIGHDTLESLAIYGFFKDFSIAVDENVSTLSLSIEGLSAAAKTAPLIGDIGWSDIVDDDPAHPKPEDGATVGATPVEKAQIIATADAIAAAQAQIAEIESSVTADFSAVHASVAALNSEVDAAQVNIASLQSVTSAVQQGLATLQGEVDAAEASISTINAQVGGLATQVGTVSGNLAALTSEVGTVSGNLSTLSGRVGTISVDVSGLASRISSAEGEIDTVQSTVSTQGAAIASNSTAISNVQGSLATLTTRVSASQTNILSNGGMENGFATGVLSNGGFSFSVDPTWGPIATSTTNGTRVFQFAPITNVRIGARYWISCDPLAYGSSYIYCDLLFLNSAGTVLLDGGQNAQNGQFDFSGNETRRGLIAVSAIAPANTASIRARVVAEVVGGAIAGFRRVKVETGETWSSFSSEASVYQQFQAISTLDTNVASLTTRVSAAESSVTQNATAISTANGNIASLTSTVSTQGGAISSLQSVTTTQGGTIAQHTSDIATANANISSNATAISTANGNISSLTTRVGAAESSITQNATAISNVTGRTATLENTVSSQGASISTLQTTTSTISGNLATLTTRVSASSPNLLPNGGLENGFNTGVSDPGGFGFYTGNWGPIASTTTNGLRVFTFTPYANPQIGAQYTFAVDPLNIGASDIYANILCLNSSGGVILDPPAGGSGSAGDFSTNDVRRALMACTITVPSGTASLLCRVYGTVRDSQPLGFRRAKLERGPTWTPYTAEASIVQTWSVVNTATGSIASLTTRVGTAESNITQNATAISNTNGNLASLTSTVSTQGGAISSLQSVTTAQGSTIAQHTSDISTANANISSNATAISTLSGSVATLTNRVSASGTNLLPNGGLANGFGSGVAGTGNFGFDNSQFWGPIAVTSAPGTQVFSFAAVPANPGSIYTLHCDPIAYQAGCLAFVDLLFRNSAGQVIYDGPQNAQNGPFDFSENNARRALIAVSAQAPAGTVDMVARFVGEVANGGPVGFRRMKLEHGANWTAFSDEASVVQTFSALSSLGTSYASLTTRVSSAEGSVTSLQSSMSSANGSISTLQSNVSSLNGSVSTLQQSSSTQAGQISTLQSTVSAQGTTISSNATAISTLQGSLATLTTRVSANQPNLLNNGGLENGFAGIASSTANWYWGDTAEWGPTAATTTNGTQVLQFADITAVQPGATYWIHCDPIAYGSSTIYCDLLFYDNAGGLLLDGPQNRQDGQFNFSPDDTRRGMIAVSAVAPSGTAVIKPRVVANVIGNQIAGFRRIKVETGPTWSRFSSEASVMQQFQALSTLNSSYSSLSTTVSSQGGQVNNLQTAYTGLNGTVSTLQSTVSAQGSSISTLQTAQSTQAGQITTLETKLVSGGGNLLQNSDFAIDMTFWGFNQHGSAHTGGRDFLGDNYRPANEHVASIYHSNNNPADYAYWTSQLVAVEQGKFYEFSVGAANARAGVLIYLRFLYGDSSIAADFTAAKSYYSEGNNLVNFPTIYARGKAPPGVYWVQCLMLKFGTDAGQSDSYAWFVRPQLVEVPGLTGGPVAYSPGGTSAIINVQAQAISSATGQLSSLQTTVSTQGAQVNNLQTAYSGLNGTVATLQSTVSANGAAISTLQSTTSTLQGNVASLTTRVSAAGTNLLPNGGLENGFNNGIGDPGGFNLSGGAWGPHAVSTANGLRVFQFAPVGGIQIGAQYTFAVDPLNFGASDLYCNMILVDSSGGVIQDVPAKSPLSSGDFSADDVRRSQVACTATIPAGTASIVCRVYGTVRDGQPLGFRRAKLERGSTWTPYSAEATIVQQFQTLSTLNTQYASLSTTVGTQGVTIGTQQTAITTLNGNVATLFGQWGVEINVAGHVSGVKLNNNGSRSDFIVQADRFAVTDGSTIGYPFEVVNGITRIKTAVIGDATIDTLKIANGAITNLSYGSGLATVTTGFTQIATVTMTPVAGSSVMKIDVAGVFETGLGATGGTQYGWVQVRRGSEVIVSAFKVVTGQGVSASFSTFAILTGLSGPQTFTIEARNERPTAAPPTGEPSTVRATISVTEFKK